MQENVEAVPELNLVSFENVVKLQQEVSQNVQKKNSLWVARKFKSMHFYNPIAQGLLGAYAKGARGLAPPLQWLHDSPQLTIL